jgi:serine protease Do
MKARLAFYLLLALTLTAGVSMAQETAPTTPSPDPFQVRSFSLLVDDGGFLGVNAEDINNENMARYGMRAARGVGVTSVVKDSPAEKAGLKKGDVILRVDGDNVTSVRKLTRLISEIAPDQSVKLSISRAGAEQEVAVTIGKREDMSDVRALSRLKPEVWKWEMPDSQVLAFGGNRRIGVSTTALTKQLADYFGVVDGKGVLVTSVTEDGPAAKAGIKAGDVITAINGEKIEGAGDLARAINKKRDGDVSLTIIRNKREQTISVTPKEGSFPFVTPNATPQIGRTIVIPRIEIPDLMVSTPRIEIPDFVVSTPRIALPSINIQLPRISPRVIVGPRVIKSTTHRPI